MQEINTANKFGVGAKMDMKHVVLLFPVPQVLTNEDALNLAAYLAVLADPMGEEFQKVYQAIRSS